ncbi:TetR/AcrR family transcriptional regulator [Paraburkholderia nemoris]|jgi:TetR/AcrR family transcriptional repressor of mexJK operon|nr:MULTISPECIES: TetR/AcrR family transcriptional regulator [Paraburkholderia]KPD20016.1 TetR family transcriptional regulator [Burkholderia sp. ST111]MBK5147758.1 TetR/AcrR family transcriptional regulator [Burkholderia sp. R-69608]MBK3744909.1 TetR/AcrR family transcriptional regulator [Paraburkholderia aspalathi]MBK3778658.1 TetR/AcrR family transcriptional regulator [Paraburkholderia aspalathi]MBK3812395.1 TetR/AcrR family transcriptional regulator [Paraburkholderia aspalathi]
MDTSSLPGLSPLQCRKRSAILDGAKTVFLRGSFGMATMDDVASAAGVGKQTVYRHFKSKEALFVGLVSAMCAQVGAVLASAQGEQSDGEPEVELRELGWVLARSLITPDSLGLYRAIVAEAARFPELGQVFYENGAKVVRAFAAKILRRRFDESTAALRAATFVQLVLGDAHLELTLGYTVPDVEARFALQIDEAVAAALR